MSIKKNSMLMVFSKFLKAFLDIFSIMLLSRYLMVEQYGFYRQFIISDQIIISIFALGLPASTMYFLSSKNKDKYLPNVYVVLAVVSILPLFLSGIISNIFDINFKTDFFSNNIMLLAFIYSASIFVNSSENMIIAMKKTKYMPIYVTIPSTFWLLGILFSWYFKKDLIFILIISLIRYLIYLIITIFFISQRFNFRNINFEKMKEVFLFGIPVGVSSMIGLISTNIDKLVIGNFYDIETFAIFSNGAYEIPFLTIISGSLFSVVIPSLKELFESNKTKEINLLWNKAGTAMITIIIPLASTCILFAETIVLFLFSEKYIASIPYFMLYQTKLFARIFLYGSFFIAAGKSKLYMYNAIFSMSLNFILDIILVQVIGPIGAVIATVISVFVLVMLQILQISKILSMSIKEVYPWKKWFISIIITLFLSYIIRIIYTSISSNIFVGLIFMTLSFIVSFLVLSKFIDNQIESYFMSALKKIITKK